MKDICLQFATKIKVNINLLIFLYGGNQMNLELTFKEQACPLDYQKKEMNILVKEKQIDELICPKCGEKIKLNEKNIKEIIPANYNIIDTLNDIKFNIDNIFTIIIIQKLFFIYKMLKVVKSNYFLNFFFSHTSEKFLLEVVKYNKSNNRVQNLFNNADNGIDDECQNLIKSISANIPIIIK